MTLTAITTAEPATETGISRAAVRRSGAWGAAAIALLLAGCGSSSSGTYNGFSSPGAGSGAAPQSSTAQGIPAAAARTLTQTAKVGWRLNGARIFGPARAPVYGTGPFNLAAARGSAVIDLPEVRHQEPGTEHVIFLPSLVYLQPKAGPLAVLPRDKRWLSAPLAGSESVSVNFPEFVAQVEGVNPVLLLRELEWGATRAVPLGPGRQIVDHAAAERFRVSVDLTGALSRARGPAAPAFSQAIQEQLLGGGATSFTVLTWVDRQGRVVQMQTQVPGTGEGTELMALSYFGSPVRVAAPPASQVIDIGSLTPSGERESNGGGDTDGG